MQARKTRILAELPAQLLTRPRPWVLALVVGTSLMGVVAATAVAPGSDIAGVIVRPVIETLPAPSIAIEADSELPFVYNERIQPGDTLQSLFLRLGIEDSEALAFLSDSDEGKRAIRQLRAGRSVMAMVRSDGQLVSFSLPVGNSGQSLLLERDDKLALQLRQSDGAAQSTLVEMRSGVIRSSLYGATDDAGVPDSVATQMAEIFGTEIDFHTDLRKDDRFNVVLRSTLRRRQRRACRPHPGR